MNRRNFLALSGTAGIATLAAPAVAAESSSAAQREYYELRQLVVEKEEQKRMIDTFLKEAMLPAANRIGIKPVGVFYPEKGLSPIYVLIPHPTLDSLGTWMEKLRQDADFMAKAAEFIDAPASAPAFKRVESSLMIAFKGFPRIETPAREPGRVFQLRIYESPSVKTNLKKIEMFNDAGEIKLFREVGLTPVFFGQTLVGSKMPNLTYMLGFNSMEEQKAAWQKFGSHPEWKRLSKMPEYADKTILSNITNLPLTAAPYSQI